MTPKEKADSIFQQMYKILWHTNSDPIHCKQCAIVAVDEIRDIIPLITDIQQYWIDVKAEIEKL
jgi:hypothetical protein